MFISKKMKIEIYYLNTKISTEISKNIQVKDLINDLKKYLNSTDSNFVLLDSDQKQLKETDTITNDKTKNSLTFYLIKSSIKNNALINSDVKDKSKEDLKMNQLIMKCTGAKRALNIKNCGSAIQTRLGFFDLIDNRNNQNEEGGNNAFERLINLLQLLEENEINNPGSRDGQMGNNAPVEADERSLRELQDMGFAEDRARQALINSRNDINRATELLLGEEGD